MRVDEGAKKNSGLAVEYFVYHPSWESDNAALCDLDRFASIRKVERTFRVRKVPAVLVLEVTFRWLGFAGWRVGGERESVCV